MCLIKEDIIVPLFNFNFIRTVFTVDWKEGYFDQFCVSPGVYGLEVNNDLSGGSSTGNIETYHSIQLSQDPSFSIQHIEVKYNKYLHTIEIYIIFFTKDDSKKLFSSRIMFYDLFNIPLSRFLYLITIVNPLFFYSNVVLLYPT